MNKPVKRAAVLHDMCSVGKAAMTNILPVLSVLGIEACPVPTMVLSTHTGGFGRPAVYPLPEFLPSCAAHLAEERLQFDLIFLGYMGTWEAVRGAISFLEEFPGVPVFLDPIMGDHGKYYANFDAAYGEGIQALVHKSQIITPNFTESCLLCKRPYPAETTEMEVQAMAEELAAKGCSRLIITSVPLPEYPMSIALWDNGAFQLLRKKAVGRSYPGTGNLFSAVLAASLLNGRTLIEGVEAAHSFVADCIMASDAAGYDTREGVLLEKNLWRLLPVGRTNGKF